MANETTDPSTPSETTAHPLVTYLRELADGPAKIDAHKLRAAANALERSLLPPQPSETTETLRAHIARLRAIAEECRVTADEYCDEAEAQTVADLRAESAACSAGAEAIEALSRVEAERIRGEQTIQIDEQLRALSIIMNRLATTEQRAGAAEALVETRTQELRRLIIAWDTDDNMEFLAASTAARKALGLVLADADDAAEDAAVLLANGYTADGNEPSLPAERDQTRRQDFEAGWSAGFQEALQPDMHPERNRCEDAFAAYLQRPPTTS